MLEELMPDGNKHVSIMLPRRRKVAPIDVLPIDVRPISPREEEWRKQPRWFITPKEEEEEDLDPPPLSKAAAKRARKNHANPNPRRQLTVDDYVSAHLLPPATPRKATVSNTESESRSSPSTSLGPQLSTNYSWPAPSTSSQPQPSMNRSWSASATGSSSQREQNKNDKSIPPTRPTNDQRTPWVPLDARARQDDRPTASRSESERRRESTAVAARPTGALRTIETGTIYPVVRIIETDASLDPPPHRCFNCWVGKHSFTRCPLPKQHDFCRNCGRKEVSLATCPRCSEAYQEAQQRRTHRQTARSASRAEARRHRLNLPTEGRAGSSGPSAQRGEKRLRESSHSGLRDQPAKRPSQERTTLSLDSNEASTSGTGRHETLRILEEMRGMPQHLREGVIEAICHEFRQERERAEKKKDRKK